MTGLTPKEANGKAGWEKNSAMVRYIVSLVIAVAGAGGGSWAINEKVEKDTGQRFDREIQLLRADAAQQAVSVAQLKTDVALTQAEVVNLRSAHDTHDDHYNDLLTLVQEMNKDQDVLIRMLEAKFPDLHVR